MVFDTTRLVADSGHALIATVVAGKSPVGVAVAGDNVVTADSNRFSQAGRTGEWLSVIHPATSEVIGNIAVGLFPRELCVTADGRTLLVTNFSSNSLALIDLARLTPAYFAQQKPAKRPMTRNRSGSRQHWMNAPETIKPIRAPKPHCVT